MFDLRIFLERTDTKKTEPITVRHFDKKQVIYCQGAVADSIYYILCGKIKLTVVSAQGKEAVVALMRQGDFLGESCLVGQTHRVSTADVIERTTVIEMKKATMEAMLKDEPEYASMFLNYVITRSIRSEEDRVDMLFNCSEKRLARLLLLLSNYDQEIEQELHSPRLSQEILAEMIGSTRARVSSFMSKFRRLGLIDYRVGGELVVHKRLLTILSDRM